MSRRDTALFFPGRTVIAGVRKSVWVRPRTIKGLLFRDRAHHNHRSAGMAALRAVGGCVPLRGSSPYAGEPAYPLGSLRAPPTPARWPDQRGSPHDRACCPEPCCIERMIGASGADERTTRVQCGMLRARAVRGVKAPPWAVRLSCVPLALTACCPGARPRSSADTARARSPRGYAR